MEVKTNYVGKSDGNYVEGGDKEEEYLISFYGRTVTPQYLFLFNEWEIIACHCHGPPLTILSCRKYHVNRGPLSPAVRYCGTQ